MTPKNPAVRPACLDGDRVARAWQRGIGQDVDPGPAGSRSRRSRDQPRPRPVDALDWKRLRWRHNTLGRTPAPVLGIGVGRGPRHLMHVRVLAWLGIVVLAWPATAAPQVQTDVPPPVAGARPATVERIKVRGAALEGNLEGNAVDRDVLVFLPPSYPKDKGRRYPTVYALHGYSIGAEQWIREIHAPQTIESAFAQGAREMIVVVPDSKTRHNGSMYSSSPTVGDFERYIARDLVSYIDAHYRSRADRHSRGLVGHSMGGYGATRIGMKHADVFGSLYIMSPCCLSPRGPGQPTSDLEKTLASAKGPEDVSGLPFGARAQLAAAAAWAPNPQAPPFYLDLPTKDGEPRADVLAKFAANSPIAFIDQWIGNLRRYRGIAIDVGDQDGLRADSGKLHDALDRYTIAHTFEIYPGTHTSKVAERFQNHVLPFFHRTLCPDTTCK